MAQRTRRRRKRKVSDGATLAAAGGGFLAGATAVQVIREHLAIAGILTAVALAAAGAWAYWRSTQARTLAEHERNVSITDDMTGTEFEHYVAKLMRASGISAVKVSGGAGDMGADIVGRTRDGRRVVVQCKRYRGNLGSPHVQRFAGTARDIHRADIALLVTTGRPTAQAREVARLCRITMIDRPALARWVSTQMPPLGS